MSIEIKVPELPESVADAVIANWHKQVGELIGMDEVLLDLETDKVILEVPALRQGIVKEILFAVGDTVTSGQLLAVIDDSAAAVANSDNVQPVVTPDKKTQAANKEIAAMSP